MWKLSITAKILQAPYQGNDINFTNISTDTRTLRQGDLFVALKGEHFNGNLFVAEAEQKGAAAVVVSEDVICHIPILRVADTRIALGQLAAFHRQQFSFPVIALTGSCGKTTTKAMLANILQQCGSTLATVGTLNNDIGVPKTLLQLRKEHQFAVIEMGANHRGEIAYLTNITKPTVAFITNAAPAHLEGFGDLAGVAQAKGEIFQGLTRDGVALINADDGFKNYWQGLVNKHKVIYFGKQNSAAITAKDIQLNPEGYASFQLITPQGTIPIQLKIMGEHNVMNALAAAAAAQAVGASLKAIKAGLETAQPVYKRLVIYPGQKSATIIDDSYNANPLSVTAAMQLLAQKSGKKILALGDMRELGPEAKNYHETIGRTAKQLKIDCLFAYGELSAFTVKAFGADGYHFSNQALLISALQKQLNADVTVLVKGSLSTNMSKVVEALRSVMPAKAGIQQKRRSRPDESQDPEE